MPYQTKPYLAVFTPCHGQNESTREKEDIKTQNELNQILELYVQEELRPYLSKFPNSFFKEIFRIYKWPYKAGSTQRPSVVGKFINKYVYEALPPNVLPKIQELNPITDKGWRKWKNFQFLAETGNEHVDRQITAVITLLRISDSKPEFDRHYEKAFSREWQQNLPLVLDVDTGEMTKQQ